VSIWAFQNYFGESTPGGRAWKCALVCLTGLLAAILFAAAAMQAPAQNAEVVGSFQGRDYGSPTLATETSRKDGEPSFSELPAQRIPPRVIQAERFLSLRGQNRFGSREGSQSGTPGRCFAGQLSRRGLAAKAQPQSAQGTAAWLPLGPAAVQSQSFGLVTGRISSLALDPSDATGNTLYVGTTGGGVWKSQNANTSSAANISFVFVCIGFLIFNSMRQSRSPQSHRAFAEKVEEQFSPATATQQLILSLLQHEFAHWTRSFPCPRIGTWGTQHLYNFKLSETWHLALAPSTQHPPTGAPKPATPARPAR